MLADDRPPFASWRPLTLKDLSAELVRLSQKSSCLSFPALLRALTHTSATFQMTQNSRSHTSGHSHRPLQSSTFRMFARDEEYPCYCICTYNMAPFPCVLHHTLTIEPLSYLSPELGRPFPRPSPTIRSVFALLFLTARLFPGLRGISSFPFSIVPSRLEPVSPRILQDDNVFSYCCFGEGFTVLTGFR